MASEHVIVVGAGAFGGWTALCLLRKGYRVTLVDPWGPGNARASSGGETRLIRGIYGADAIYIRMVAQAFAYWRELEAQTGQQLYVPTGALWMFRGDDSYARASLPHLAKAGLQVQSLSQQQAADRYPQVRWDDVSSTYFEEEAGYLFARRACEVVWQRFLAEGGTYRRTAAKPGPIKGDELLYLQLETGEKLSADTYVFATGPWMAQSFPELLGTLIRPTRQELYFFGLDANAAEYAALPPWMDYGDSVFYGVPDAGFRGFKAGDDTRGDLMDPTTAERTASAAGLEHIRSQIRWRFPALQALPLLESRVCQYENTPDGQFIIDRHPQARNLWLLGGGSGHGFKLGPVIGHYMTSHIANHTETDPCFGLARFDGGTPTFTSQLQRG